MARHASLNEFISDEQEANLRKLAAYLLTLPADYPDFEMDNFVAGMEGSPPAFVPACGTAACAVGHGPAAGFAPNGTERWSEYSERLFIPVFYSNEWEWCFGQAWSKCDNTVHGAAFRILWMLENGLPDYFDGEADYGEFVSHYTDMVPA